MFLICVNTLYCVLRCTCVPGTVQYTFLYHTHAIHVVQYVCTVHTWYIHTLTYTCTHTYPLYTTHYTYAQGGEESSHQWSKRIISPNSDFWSALTEHEWNWIQLLIWIVVTGVVIDYCHGYMNAWMYGSWSTFPCSNLIQAKELEQFQYFAIKWNSVLQLNLFNSCRVPKKMVVDYYVCTVVQVVIF